MSIGDCEGLGGQESGPAMASGAPGKRLIAPKAIDGLFGRHKEGR